MIDRSKVLRLALSVAVTAAIAISAVFWVLDAAHQTTPQLAASLFSLTVPAVYAGVGAVLTARRPENTVGWLCTFIGLVWGLLDLGDAAVRSTDGHGP